MTACPGDEEMARFVEGKLPEESRSTLREHMRSCERCRVVVLDALRSSSSDGSVDPTLPSRLHLPSLSQGTVVGRYTIQWLLGAGGMGEVYRATDSELGREIAVKVLRPEVGGTSLAARARFLREAQALARLSHPNVVTIYDVGDLDDQVFVAMELVAGVNLSEWMETPRAWREVREVFLAAGRGLEAAHANGIIHRDFKPHNVMVGESRVVVLDFGLARRVDDRTGETLSAPSLDRSLTMTGDLIGTPAYMSLEQLERKPATQKSDQFSFCAALYEALFGRRPFHGTTPADWIAARKQPLEIPKGPPRWLRELVARGLDPDPEHRFPSMGALLVALACDLAPRTRVLQMRLERSAARFIAGPVGRYVKRGSFALWCASPTLYGTTFWGVTAGDDMHELLKLWELDRVLGRCDVVADTSLVRAVDPVGFGQLAEYMRAHVDHYQAKIRRQSLILPDDDMSSALVSGLATMIGYRHEWRIFTKRAEALEWLGHPDAERAMLQVDEVVSETLAAEERLEAVRRHLSERPGESAAQVAAALGVSAPVLQRDLKLAGTSFQAEARAARGRR